MSSMKLASKPFSKLFWIMTPLNTRIFNCLSHYLSNSRMPLVPFIFRALARWCWHHMTSQPLLAYNWAVRELRVMIQFHLRRLGVYWVWSLHESMVKMCPWCGCILILTSVRLWQLALGCLCAFSLGLSCALTWEVRWITLLVEFVGHQSNQKLWLG